MEHIERPKYYDLLSEAEIALLAPVLEILQERRGEILSRFHGLYLAHFGDARKLSEPDFLDLYGRDVDAMVRSLSSRDMAGFAADLRALGLELLGRGVPFDEVVASMQLFEESTLACLLPHLDPGPAGVRIYQTLNKVSHCRIIVLAGIYLVPETRPALAAAPPTAVRVPTMEEAERDLIRKALETTGGNKLQAARLMRISRHRLYDKLRKFAITESAPPAGHQSPL